MALVGTTFLSVLSMLPCMGNSTSVFFTFLWLLFSLGASPGVLWENRFISDLSISLAPFCVLPDVSSASSLHFLRQIWVWTFALQYNWSVLGSLDLISKSWFILVNTSVCHLMYLCHLFLALHPSNWRNAEFWSLSICTSLDQIFFSLLWTCVSSPLSLWSLFLTAVMRICLQCYAKRNRFHSFWSLSEAYLHRKLGN